MLLVQKIELDEIERIEHNIPDGILLLVFNLNYQNHKGLETYMKKFPEQFNAGCEYTTIELGKFLKVTYPKIAVVETVEEESGNG